MYLDRDDYQKLKEVGIQLQPNILSLIRFYRETIKNKTEYLLSNGFFDLWGTDCHSFHMAHIYSHKLRKSILRILSRPLI